MKFEEDEGAVLSPLDSANLYEPWPLFQFLAPELHVRSANFLHETTFLYNEAISNSFVDYSIDFYSLGKVLIWLVAINYKQDFHQEILKLQRKHPLLSGMISPNPKSRPSSKTLQRDFPALVSSVFDVPCSYSSNEASPAGSHNQNSPPIILQRQLNVEANRYDVQSQNDIELAKKMRGLSTHNSHNKLLDDNDATCILSNGPPSDIKPSSQVASSGYEEVVEAERILQKQKEIEEEQIMKELMMSSDEDDDGSWNDEIRGEDEPALSNTSVDSNIDTLACIHGDNDQSSCTTIPLAIQKSLDQVEDNDDIQDLEHDDDVQTVQADVQENG